MGLPETMKAVVFEGPYKVSVKDCPVPKYTVQNDTDIIVKVEATALCGSELHIFRGRENCAPGFIMGHEFTGTIVEAGAAVDNLKVGDKVITPFTVSCGSCFYCQNAQTARCTASGLFGSPGLDGGQAEYVRVPLAPSSCLPCPSSISSSAAILMADIFPTGFYGVKSAIELLPAPSSSTAQGYGKRDLSEATIVVIGCGPVGLCAVASAVNSGAKKVFAVDGVDSRLELARGMGAQGLNFKEGNMKEKVLEATGGRGADMIVEVVGQAAALKTAYELVRPFGAISSIGVHGAEIPFSAEDGYDKNVRLQMGRCPVRGIFPEALAVLEKVQDKLSFMFDKIMPLADAVEGYELFDKMAVQKVIFTP